MAKCQTKIDLLPLVVHLFLFSLCSELILKTPEEFKIAVLQDVAKLFGKNSQPYSAGFGNRPSVSAWRMTGLQSALTFAINGNGWEFLFMSFACCSVSFHPPCSPAGQFLANQHVNWAKLEGLERALPFLCAFEGRPWKGWTIFLILLWVWVCEQSCLETGWDLFANGETSTVWW